MEWSLLNILLSIGFVMMQNGFFTAMRLIRKPILPYAFSVLLLLDYAAMLIYVLSCGGTRQDVLLLILASLICAFIPLGKGDKHGI